MKGKKRREKAEEEIKQKKKKTRMWKKKDGQREKKMSERKWPFVKCDTISKHGQEDGKNCSPNKKTVACCDVSRCAIRILRPERAASGEPLLIMKANSAACNLIALLVPPPPPFLLLFQTKTQREHAAIDLSHVIQSSVFRRHTTVCCARGVCINRTARAADLEKSFTGSLFLSACPGTKKA